MENEDLNKGDHGKEKDLWSPGQSPKGYTVLDFVFYNRNSENSVREKNRHATESGHKHQTPNQKNIC